MPRPARHDTVVPGFPHHLLLRGNNRRRLFSYDSCHPRFLALLASSSRRLCVPVHAAALMSNHVHLVVTPADAGVLADFVQAVAQPYAQRRNHSQHATGKLFEQRYVSLPIGDDAYLATTVAYVDLNPVRARLARDPAAYRWSTAAAHLGEGGHAAVRALWSPHAWYTALGASDAIRAARYRDWLASRADSGFDAISDIAGDRDDERGHRRGRPVRPGGVPAA